MKRHESLIELSRDHHHSLALATRILRNPQADHSKDIQRHAPDLLNHFLQEEQQFAGFWSQLPDPSSKTRFDEDHAHLRAMLNQPQYHSAEWNSELAQRLQAHVRFEERELFEQITQHCLRP